MATTPRSRDGSRTRRGGIDRAIRDLRNYIFGLRPGILADRQLDQALQRARAREFQERTDVLTIVDVDESVAAELASRAADVVQLVREALSNVGPARPGHDVPGLPARAPTAAPNSRSTTTGSASTVARPHGDGHCENLRARVDVAGRGAHDRSAWPAKARRSAPRSPCTRPRRAAGAGARAPAPRRPPGGRIDLLHDERRHHAEHAPGPFGVRQDVAVERPRPGVVGLDQDVEP